MADSSLDDFFAKKDKKSKKKTKSSKLTPDDILAKTDEPVKKEKKSKKDKEKSQTSEKADGDGGEVNAFSKEEEEKWKDVEEEEEKDYSGLRIANLQISEKENEEADDQSQDVEGEEDENGEVKEKKDTGQQGPWKPQSGGHVQVAAPTPVVVQEEAPKPKEEPKTAGKYVPPGQRAAAAAAASGASPGGPTLPSHLRRKKNAPNLRSEEEFPTLGGGYMPHPNDSDTRSFERVQFGGRQMEDPSKTTQQLSLGNKFSALQD